MWIETLEKLNEQYRVYVNGGSSDTFIIKSLNDWHTKNQIKAVEFINKLLNLDKCTIEDINVNDWNSSPSVKVYVSDKVYQRFSEYDFKNLCKYLNKS